MNKKDRVELAELFGDILCIEHITDDSGRYAADLANAAGFSIREFCVIHPKIAEEVVEIYGDEAREFVGLKEHSDG